jgi:hypothetical protein
MECEHERSFGRWSGLRDIDNRQPLGIIDLDRSVVKTGLGGCVCYWITLLSCSNSS